MVDKDTGTMVGANELINEIAIQWGPDEAVTILKKMLMFDYNESVWVAFAKHSDYYKKELEGN